MTAIHTHTHVCAFHCTAFAAPAQLSLRFFDMTVQLMQDGSYRSANRKSIIEEEEEREKNE